MATLLYRLGHFSVRNRRWVLITWLVILAGLGTTAVTANATLTSTFSIPGMKSQTALDQLNEKIPAAGGTSGKIVVAAPEGKTLAQPAYQNAIEAMVNGTKGLDKVTSVQAPIAGQSISKNGRIGYITINFAGQISEIPVATQDKILKLTQANHPDSLQVELGGGAVKQAPSIGSTEGIGALVALVVLFITFSSLIAAGLPMLTALIGIGIGLSGILTVAAFVDMSNTAPILALMLGLAVGIDYALFIVSKHRDLLRRGRAIDESIARATGTAGTAVLFAGLTVVIALVGLTVVGIPFLSVMGLGSAATVAVAVLIAITLVPALLSYTGLKVLPKSERTALSENLGTDHPAADVATPNRWIKMVVGRPIVVLVVGILALGIISIPAFSLRLGLPTDATAAHNTTKRQAYDLLAEGFGDGSTNPLIVTLEPKSPLTLDPAMKAQIDSKLQQQLQQQAQANPQLAAIATPELIAVAQRQAEVQTLLKPYVDAIGNVKNVADAKAVAGTADGSFFVIQVIPKTGPTDERTTTLVHDLNAETTTLAKANGATLAVTGITAVQIDISQKLADALPVYLAIVVGLAIILLLLVFRSLVVPVKAVIGFLLSVASAFGAVVAVYQWGWLSGIFGVDTPSPIISFLPVLLVGILFGLAMDYEMFLVSGMRESYAHGADPRTAVVRGFSAGSRVVSAAAIIMFSVFAGFIFAPDTIIASIGFSLGVGVLVDAFVVRMTLVPAAMYLFGKAGWFLPEALDRLLPDVDIEGTKLLASLQKTEASRESETESVPV